MGRRVHRGGGLPGPAAAIQAGSRVYRARHINGRERSQHAQEGELIIFRPGTFGRFEPAVSTNASL